MKVTTLSATIIALLIIAGFFFLFNSMGSNRAKPATLPPLGKKKAVQKPAKKLPVQKTSLYPVKQPEPGIFGHVFLSDGKPAWRAEVKCKLGPIVTIKRTRTNRRGEFHFYGLDKNKCYSIEASAAGYAPVRINNREVGPADIVITLKYGARLFLEVLTGDVGMPLENFKVTLHGPDARIIDCKKTNGYKTIEGLKGGMYSVYVSAAGYSNSKEKTVLLKEGKETRESFLLYPGNSETNK